MESKKTMPRYTSEFRDRAVRLVRDNRDTYGSDNAAFIALSSKLDCSSDSLRAWYRQAECDAGNLAGPTSEEKAQIKSLEREVRELRQANEILKKASAYFAPSR